jgi:hypothetical protein
MLRIFGELMAEEKILNAKKTGLMELIVCFILSALPQAKEYLLYPSLKSLH